MADTTAASVARTILTVPFTRRTWAEVVYLLVTAPLATAGFLVVAFMVAFGVFFSILVVPLVVTVPLLAMVLLGARHFGGVHRALAAAFLGEDVPEPRPGPCRRVGSGVG